MEEVLEDELMHLSTQPTSPVTSTTPPTATIPPPPTVTYPYPVALMRVRKSEVAVAVAVAAVTRTTGDSETLAAVSARSAKKRHQQCKNRLGGRISSSRLSLDSSLFSAGYSAGSSLLPLIYLMPSVDSSAKSSSEAVAASSSS